MTTKHASWRQVSSELSRVRPWILVVLLIPAVCFGLNASLTMVPKGWWSPLLLCLCLAGGVALVWQPFRLHYLALKRLADGCFGTDKTLVSILILQGEAITGHDHGVLYLRSGDLRFKGRRTEFSIPLGQEIEYASTRTIYRAKYTILDLPEGLTLAMREYRYNDAPAMGRVRDILDDWFESKAPPGQVLVLPPKEILPLASIGIPMLALRLAIVVLAVWNLSFYVRTPFVKDHWMHVVLDTPTAVGFFMDFVFAYRQRLKQRNLQRINKGLGSRAALELS